MPPLSPSFDEACEACGHSQIDPDWFDIFKVMVCFDCKDAHKDYSLITKTQAKAEFLLTEEELADKELFNTIRRKNPHNPHWSDMVLYLYKQVRAFSIEKFGSDEKIQEALMCRSDKKCDRKSKRFIKKLKELRSRTRIEKAQLLSIPEPRHQHKVEDNRCKVCNVKMEIEEL